MCTDQVLPEVAPGALVLPRGGLDAVRLVPPQTAVVVLLRPVRGEDRVHLVVVVLVQLRDLALVIGEVRHDSRSMFLVCRKLVKKYRKFSATKNVIPFESAVLMALDPNVLEHEQKKGMAV